MEVQEFMRIVIYICTLLFGGLALWYQGNAKVSGRVATLIQRAEVLYSDWTKAGGVKFEWVVGQLWRHSGGMRDKPPVRAAMFEKQHTGSGRIWTPNRSWLARS